MKIIFAKLPLFSGFIAINFFGFLFIKKKYKEDLMRNPEKYNRLIRHEAIHTAQGKQLLWVFFYIFYFIEWLIRLIQYRKFTAAYNNISFEREAYTNEHDINYLQNRKAFASFGYVKKSGK